MDFITPAFITLGYVFFYYWGVIRSREVTLKVIAHMYKKGELEKLLGPPDEPR